MFSLVVFLLVFIAVFLFDFHPLFVAIITGILAASGLIGWGVTAILLILYIIVEFVVAIAS